MVDFLLSNSMTTNECFYENAITLMLVTTEHKFYIIKKSVTRTIGENQQKVLINV